MTDYWQAQQLQDQERQSVPAVRWICPYCGHEHCRVVTLGKVRMVAAMHDLSTGAITWFARLVVLKRYLCILISRA